MSWVPTATMSLAPRLVGQEHRGVLAGALHDELDVGLAERLELLVARVPAVGVHVVHVLGADLHRRGRHGVEVAQDDVRGEAHLEQGVGAAVDTDEHRPVLADVGAQDLEVLLVVVARGRPRGRGDPRTSCAGSACTIGAKTSRPRARTYSSVFSAKRWSSWPMPSRASSIRRSISSSPRTWPSADLRRRRGRARRREVEGLPVGDEVHDLLAGGVDQHDPGPDEAHRPAVRIAAGDARPRRSRPRPRPRRSARRRPPDRCRRGRSRRCRRARGA